MKVILSALFAATASAALSVQPVTSGPMDYTQAYWTDMVKGINNDRASTWTAQVPRERDVYRALDLAGSYVPFKGEIGTQSLSAKSAPAAFDARTNWPQCSSIQVVRDQCGCGSCFAFGAIEAFEDRICIATNKNITLSPEDIISCHVDENMSCQGGNPIAVWQNIFAGSKGDDGAIQESCYPYQITPCPCNHHSSNSSLPACTPEGQGSTPQCDLTKKFACQDKGIFKSQAPLLIPSANMESELANNGPITVAYEVYDDFLTYKV